MTAGRVDTVGLVTMWLADGPCDSRDLRARATSQGVTTKMLRAARERLGVVVTRSGNRRSMRSTWALPSDRCQVDREKTDAPAGTSQGTNDLAEYEALATSVQTAAPLRSATTGDRPHEQISEATTVCGTLAASEAAGQPLRRSRREPRRQDERRDVADEPLTEQEVQRIARRTEFFAGRGVEHEVARTLSERLVRERDRLSSPAGSCAECQVWTGPLSAWCRDETRREPAAIWLCWAARRVGP